MLLGIIIGAVGMALIDYTVGWLITYRKAKRMKKEGRLVSVDYATGSVDYYVDEDEEGEEK